MARDTMQTKNNDVFMNTTSIDNTDYRIIKLLIDGNSNKQVASKLKIPLSTIQRRARKIVEKGLIIPKVQLNHEKFGYRTGLLHIYVSNSHIKEIAKKVLDLKGVTAVEIHIGNSDVLADFAYRNSQDLLEMIIMIKNIIGVDKVIWSERIARLPAKDGDLLAIS